MERPTGSVAHDNTSLIAQLTAEFWHFYLLSFGALLALQAYLILAPNLKTESAT